MTDQEQILALAEMDGWTQLEDKSESLMMHPGFLIVGYPPVNAVIGNKIEVRPYLGSRDAIMDLIVKVCSTDSGTAWGPFTLHFMSVIKPGWYDAERNEYPIKFIAVAFVATPRQLCESLLRATGKL